MATAFSTQGATPNNPFSYPSTIGLLGSTPQAKALSSASSPTLNPASAYSSGGITPVTPKPVSVPSPAPAPTNQAVKKQTVTTAGGDTHTTEYHPPTAGLLSNTSPTGNTTALPGQAQGITDAQITPTETSTPTVTPPATNQGLITAGAQASQNAVNTGSNQQGEAYKLAQQYQQQLEAQQEQEAQALGAIGTSPIPLEFQQGRAAVLQGQEAAIQAAQAAALQGESNLANIGANVQSTGISGLGSNAGLLQPSNQYSTLSLGQYQTDASGNPVGGGIGAAASNAVRAGVINNGITQGTDYANRAADLSTTLSQVDQLAPKLSNFLSQNGVNAAGSPWVNKSINTYLAQANPAAVAGANVLFGDLKTYTAQILGDSGLTPTDVGLTSSSFDPGQFTPSQLSDFIQTLSVAGQTRLAPLQQSSKSALSAASQGQTFSGTQANTALPTSVSKASPGYPTNKLYGLTAGTFGQIFNGIGGISGVGSAALGALGEYLLTSLF